MNYENIEQKCHLWAENENIKELGKNSKGVLYLPLKLGEWRFWAGAQYGNYSILEEPKCLKIEVGKPWLRIQNWVNRTLSLLCDSRVMKDFTPSRATPCAA